MGCKKGKKRVGQRGRAKSKRRSSNNWITSRKSEVKTLL